MKTFSCLTAIGMVLTIAASTAGAIDLKESKVTQVVNDVEIISAADQKTKPAAVNDVFAIPDVLRTGKASRAELIAKDETVTRIGADTIFSFDPASRTINLKQGSLLFHSPHGKGGGTIHTGSATASVLGTTLIVTATPQGGMKVLDLEGTVEVNLSNKKKQKLSGGQMTFVLPGANQLAPVIVFRLDELVRNSLLVHGFGKPLPSIPLIQNQIDRQQKLIKSGRATDTGLLVGDSATPNQVEVLDPNTIRTKITRETGLQKALQTDANLTGASLTDPNIPTPPNRIFMNRAFQLAENPFFSGKTFTGFAGKDINFGSGDLLHIDMTPFASKPKFDFVASGILNFASSVTFDGVSPLGILTLIGGQGATFASGITLEADAANFEIVTPGTITLNNVTLKNNVGAIGLISGTMLDLSDIYVLSTGSTVFAAPDVTLNWSSDGSILKVGANDDTYFITDPATGHVTLSAPNGNLSVSGTSIQTHYLTLNSGDSILLDAQGHTLTSTGPGATATFTAPNLVTIQNTDFSSFGSVNAAANTITLVNTILNPDVPNNFGTKTGLANIDGPVVNGRLNLINVRLGSQQVTDLSQINFTEGPSTLAGINSYKKSL